ncbi:hypothetical protein U9M48_013826 [Paspalum notatum var. saurae]|uniref:SWIM-type domain-containing protein n=1 Tax=Paspalum notatum var. saurae TaxID=547442 RepID=A0AAQ3T176_PASNO
MEPPRFFTEIFPEEHADLSWVPDGYEEITSDQKFLHAIDMYWEIRRLSVQVCVMKINESDSVHDIGRQENMPCVLQGSVDPIANQIIEQPAHDIASSLVEPLVENNTEVPWVDDDVEYVGLDDEDLVSGSSDSESDGDVEFVCMEDELAVEDACGSESIVHATDLENPTIEVGITFGDGDTFKKTIRQYAIKGEYEIAAAYSESGRYRGYCKAERCQWRIHASQLQDGRTWKIKKMPHAHTCQSTGKVEKNCMASNHWVRDRVLDWLAKDPTIGAKALKKRLEEQYHLQLSYWVVWDGRNMALEQLKGKWDDSFEHVFSFKAEVEKTNPGSLVDIEFEQVGKKMRFTRMFVALKACVDGFLDGCRPFLGVDSTHLTGKWKGQLASATAIDGNNWMFPVCYAVFGSETTENWSWFFSRLHQAIGSPPGLVISTDAGKGIYSAVTQVFKNGVEHRECMRHLVANFKKRFRGEVFEKHLWPACRAYQRHRFEEHYNLMYEACPEAMKWIHDNHKHLWTRHLFCEACKCDYVTNNIAETFNSWVRHEKSLHVVDLMDRIRQLCMEKMFLRRKIARKLEGKILPNVMKDLNERSRGMKYMWRYSHKDGSEDAEMLGEVEGVTRDLVHWRHTVDLQQRTCTCRRWQVTGLPCTHALCIITSIRGYNIEDYVHEYYSVAKFKKAYGKSVKPMTDRKQWPQVNPGFKLWPPILKRTAGRPRERRYKSAAEGGTQKRTTRCKRCNQLGHMAKTCNEYVYDSDAPPPAPPKPKRKRGKKNVIVVPSKADVVPHEQPSFVEPFMSRRLLELEPATPTRAITPVQTPSPMTRGVW